jgi:hypothetical protein
MDTARPNAKLVLRSEVTRPCSPLDEYKAVKRVMAWLTPKSVNSMRKPETTNEIEYTP